VDYARIKKSGSLVHARDAVRGTSYVCPTCGLSLELRRGDDLEYFAHWRGLESTRDCDLFVPGDSAGPRINDSGVLDARVEDDPVELGLILDQVDSEWSVGLRLPEIPHDELGEVSLTELRPGSVEVTAGAAVISRISALDLRPGVGSARVQVPPTVQEYQACAAGPWPRTIDTTRWRLRSRGLEVQGTLFRLRGGEWTRLFRNSRVHFGERVLVVAEARWPRPDSILAEKYAQISSGGLNWIIWEVRLPDEPVESATVWLARLGHEFIHRPWSVELAAPPRTINERGEPVFWVGDSPVVTLEAPQAGADAMLSVKLGTDSHNASVVAPENRRVHVAISSQQVQRSRIGVFTARSENLEIAFVERPSDESLLEMLTTTPRLRVWLGDQVVGAWREPTCKVPVTSRAVPEVRVDLGVDSARARVTVWERGKQRSSPGLDGRSAARLIRSSLSTASRIELDGDNLGRVEIVPQRVTLDLPRKASVTARLSWHDHVASLGPHAEERTAPTLLEQPHRATSFVVRPVGAAALARARLALRGRRHAGGHR
jgi:hypothetical protein